MLIADKTRADKAQADKTVVDVALRADKARLVPT